MHYITGVEYDKEYKLRLCFEDKSWRLVNLEQHLDGDIFYPLKDITQFRTAVLNSDIDTVVWDNGADMSPDFLYKISTPIEPNQIRKVAETHTPYNA